MSSMAIVVRVTAPGFHCWPDAPDAVAFLRARHRHLFVFVVTLAVGHANRAHEFMLTQRAIREALDELFASGDDGYEFGARSCEMLAAALGERLHATTVTVWEDNENGGTWSA